jgi:phosphate starvation-inducible PhoH-like protein
MKRNMKTRMEVVKKEKFARVQFPQLHPMNDKQKDLLDALSHESLIIASGSAGTGKTLLSCWHAAKKLYHRDIDKVVLLRAYQPLAGRSIGFLPGELESKLIPFYQQMLDYFEDYLGKASTEIHIKNKTIEICSLETIRGRSWDNAIIIVDEAQSLFVPEVQALVTRVGKNSQLIFCGDDSGVQTDVKNGMDGLTYLKKLIEKYRISDTKTITFTRDHIVRSGLTKEFVIAFEDEMQDDAIGMAIVSTKEINSQFKKPR